MTPAAAHSSLPSDRDSIAVLHQCSNFLVVSKPADLLINDEDSDSASSRPTLSSTLSRLYPDLVDAGVPHHFRFVHRLDYSTSGVICLALNADAARRASRQFEEKRVVKLYAA